MDNILSDKQLEANRKNSQLSTGAKTPEGKSVSKYNSIKHGVLRVAHTDYESEIYGDYLQELIDEYNPETFTDKVLVERAALCYVRLFRSAKAEHEQIKAELNPKIIKDLIPNLIEIEVIQEGYTPILSITKLESIDKTILRYERNAERTLFKILHELERRKLSRQGTITPPPIAIDIDVSDKN